MANVYGFNNAPRWDKIYKNYESYAITGCKVRWVPTTFSGNVWTDQASGQTYRSAMNLSMFTFDPDTYN